MAVDVAPGATPGIDPDVTRRRDLRIAAGLVAIGAAVVALALRVEPGVQTDPLGPRLFPMAMGAAIAACGLLLGAGALGGWRWCASTALLLESEAADAPPSASSPARLLAAVGLTAAYIAAFEPLGYLLATPPYIAGMVLLHGGAGWRQWLLPPLLLTTAFYAAFRFGLLIPVPDGLLEAIVPW